MAENLSAVLYGKGDLRMENRPVKIPKSNEVQIAVKSCGLCITDIHLLDSGNVGEIAITTPNVIGHEFSGVVIKTGNDVTHVKAGDRVAVDAVVSCGDCRMCKKGCRNVCENSRYHGIPATDGGMARFATVVANAVHKIPDGVDFEEGALLEPLSVCVNAARRADVRAGDKVIVFGAGPVGLMILQVALAHGAAIVCVADIDETRLKLAKELGATHTVLFRTDETDAKTNAQKIIAEVGEDFDVALECSGAPVCLSASVYCLRPRGVVGAVGLGPTDDVIFPINDAILREVDVRGCVANNGCYPSAIKMVASKKVNLKAIISQRFRLDEVPAALDLVRQRQIIKIVIDCDLAK